jgi:hypothetical protein
VRVRSASSPGAPAPGSVFPLAVAESVKVLPPPIAAAVADGASASQTPRLSVAPGEAAWSAVMRAR